MPANAVSVVEEKPDGATEALAQAPSTSNVLTVEPLSKPLEWVRENILSEFVSYIPGRPSTR